jgi:tRNA pseudouridine65 synthase
LSETIEILYRDERLVAVNKPPGMLVHRTGIDRHETRFALQLVRDQIGRRVFPVHRLDKPTSGVLLFALDPEGARALTDQFTRRRVAKRYLAIVRGHPPGGVIDYPLLEEADPYTDALADPDKGPQEAVTEYRALARSELPITVGRYASARHALLELHPRTGRKHQIRRHMKHIFHPVIGDTSYGDGRHNRLFRERWNCGRLLLAAVELGFSHPEDGRPMRVIAGPGEEFERVAGALFGAGMG